MSKSATLLRITLLALSSLVMVGSAFAQSTLKPSVPEFTAELVIHPYDVPESTQIDPYTGEVYTYPGYVEENRSIEVTIKNQPFNSYRMADGNWSRLYYNLRLKGNFSVDDWSYYPLHPSSGYVSASHSEYTVISLDRYLYGQFMRDDSQIDFQAQALIGYDEPKYGGSAPVFVGYTFTGEASDWSNTQTISINPIETPTPSPETTPTPSPEPQQTVQIEPIVAVAIVALIVGAALGLLIGCITKK
jgi:hypothetical protein